jgi:hypothetical protein
VGDFWMGELKMAQNRTRRYNRSSLHRNIMGGLWSRAACCHFTCLGKGVMIADSVGLGKKWVGKKLLENPGPRFRGEVQDPRFLDGRTQDGFVGMAPSTGPPFTGTDG